MISGYLARETWLHSVPAGAKLLALAALSLAILPIDDWRLLVCGVVIVVAIYASLGGEVLRRVAALRPLVPLLLILFVLHGLMGDWALGAGAIARLVTMVLLADLVTMSTTMQDMMRALMPALKLFRPLGLNPKKLSLAVSLAIRFVPVLSANWQSRSEAWRVRTGRKPSWRLIGPFVAETLRMADQVAEALDARGFERAKRGGA